MREVYIVSAARTAIGKSPKGSLRNTRPDDLAAITIGAVVERCAIDPAHIEDVILGCAQPELEQGLNVARVAALRAGLPTSVPGLTVNRFCASGLEAIAIAAQRILAGSMEVAVAGGVESMTMVEFMGATTRPNPELMHSRPNTYLSMGLCVEQLAKKLGIRREEADAFAVESHRKALAAQEEGRFEAEIVPVRTSVQEQDAEGNPTLRDIVFAADEGPRRGTTIEGLAGLRTPFLADGQITAGNASQRSDGAASVLLMSGEKMRELGLKPMLRFVGYAVAAVEPEDFGVGPAFAIPKLLNQAGVGVDQLDVIEFNEAFAAQVLASNQRFPMPMDRLNPNGGAIALGHPLGCTGARQTVGLAYELGRTGGKYGMVTMCAALGMGAAGLFERV